MRGDAAICGLVILVIGLWFLIGGRTGERDPAATVSSPKFDTTGGQEMKPRWDK